MYFDNGLNSTRHVYWCNISFSTLFPIVYTLIPAINFRGKGEVGMSLCKDLITKIRLENWYLSFAHFHLLWEWDPWITFIPAGSYSGEVHEAYMTSQDFFCTVKHCIQNSYIDNFSVRKATVWKSLDCCIKVKKQFLLEYLLCSGMELI